MKAVRLLPEWVTRQAERRPEGLAVVLRDESVTYGGLEVRSNRIAGLLREAGCRRGDRVAMLVPKSPLALTAMLGVYKADAILVPLDDASPAARLERVLRSSEPRLLLAGGGTVGLLGELRAAGALPAEVPVGWIGAAGEIAGLDPAPEFTAADVDRQPPSAPPMRASTEDPAHIFYTSGSTGQPKGVAVRHSSVVRFVEWGVRHFGIAPGDRLSGHSPLPFDLSTFDIFGTFAAGAELHLVPPELNLLPHRLLGFMRETELTQWLSVPSVLGYMAGFDVLEQDDLPALRRLLWCGENFPTPALVYWMTRLPHVVFTNLYGPTETTVASSYYDVPECPRDEREAVPIGRACPGEGLSVLGEDLRPVPPGEIGELFIRGAGLSPGYWRDPRRTAAAFLPDPEASRTDSGEPGGRVYRTGDLAWVDEDGLFYLVGRADSQIKSRGYRIELGEVETAVAATGLTQEAVVTAIPTAGFEGWSICCAFVPAAGGAGVHHELRRELGRRLPAYMMPARWLAADKLPRNPNGKLDRKRVKETFQEQAEAEAPAARRAAASG